MDFLLYAISGAFVGLIVGLTGIGGGSLMTPLLLLFGIPPHIAVGTDLLYAAITKASGVVSHHKNKTIKWSITLTMAAGSIPAAIVTGIILNHFFLDYQEYTGVITTSLGVMLVLTAKGWLQRNKTTLTFLMGILLGALVTLSSVGAGAIGTAILLVLYPKLKSMNIVGTDIAHAVPLTLIGGLVHLGLGNVDYSLLAALLVGSIPAIHLGTKLGTKIPETILRQALALILLLLGTKYIFF